MNEEAPVEESGGRSSVYKTAGLAAALGLAAWLASQFLFPAQVPQDFPDLPDLSASNSELRGKIQKADAEARRRPGSAERTGNLGVLYHANQFYEQAAAAYTIARRLSPREVQWPYFFALLREETGGGPEQIEALEQTIRLNPGHVPALIKLGDWWFKQDKLDDAARYYEMASRAEGDALFGGFGLGRVAARRKDWQQVLARVSPLLAEYSHAASIHELLLEAYEATGDSGKAASARQAIAFARWKVLPPPADPWSDRLAAESYSSTRLLKQAGLLARVGNPDAALQVARRAAEVAPGDADVRHFLSRTLLNYFPDRASAVEESLAQMSEHLRLHPGDPAALWGYADEFFKAPKPPSATARLRAMLQQRANMPDAQYFLGLAADAAGETAQAVAHYQAALKSNPGNSAAYNKLGLIAFQAGRPEEAVRQFRKALQLNPVNTSARMNLGLALMQKNNYDEGLKEFEELLRTNPYDPATHFSMGFAYLYSKRPAEAAARFREGLRFRPEDADGHFGLASALAALQQHGEALAEARMALRLRPDYPPARELLYDLER